MHARLRILVLRFHKRQEPRYASAKRAIQVVRLFPKRDLADGLKRLGDLGRVFSSWAQMFTTARPSGPVSTALAILAITIARMRSEIVKQSVSCGSRQGPVRHDRRTLRDPV
jgi:hypothetical protein